MKMSKESYTYIKNCIEPNREKIVEYAPKLKESGNYKDFNTRLAFDCQRAFVPLSFVTGVLYDKEDLNDKHIKTALIKVLKEIEIL